MAQNLAMLASDSSSSSDESSDSDESGHDDAGPAPESDRDSPPAPEPAPAARRGRRRRKGKKQAGKGKEAKGEGEAEEDWGEFGAAAADTVSASTAAEVRALFAADGGAPRQRGRRVPAKHVKAMARVLSGERRCVAVAARPRPRHTPHAHAQVPERGRRAP